MTERPCQRTRVHLCAELPRRPALVRFHRVAPTFEMCPFLAERFTAKALNLIVTEAVQSLQTSNISLAKSVQLNGARCPISGALARFLRSLGKAENSLVSRFGVR